MWNTVMIQRRFALLTVCSIFLCPSIAFAADLPFRMQEIETTLKVGYAVCIADVNGDGKPDIVIVDANRVLWYENPTWKRRIIIEDQTPPDNVCIAPCDIDGDGKIDFFLGADWGRMDTTKGGTIHWLRRKASLDEKWDVFKIGEEPTVHRMRVSGRLLYVAPLMGRGATKSANWLDGRPVRVLVYPIPKDPTITAWKQIVVNEELHVVHNFLVYPRHHGDRILLASYEGLSLLLDELPVHHLSKGDQSNPNSNRGASEVAQGTLGEQGSILASVEPWHGNQIAVYRYIADLTRHVIDDQLRWGHAIQCADLDGDGADEIIVGVRDDLSKNPGERRGVRIYKCTDGKGEKWDRQLVDEGGVAVEDLVVHDLDGDGRKDIIAVGRQTGNCRIYWRLPTQK